MRVDRTTDRPGTAFNSARAEGTLYDGWQASVLMLVGRWFFIRSFASLSLSLSAFGSINQPKYDCVNAPVRSRCCVALFAVAVPVARGSISCSMAPHDGNYYLWGAIFYVYLWRPQKNKSRQHGTRELDPFYAFATSPRWPSMPRDAR